MAGKCAACEHCVSPPLPRPPPPPPPSPAPQRCSSSVAGDTSVEGCASFCTLHVTNPKTRDLHCAMCKCRACDICLPVRRFDAPPPHRLASLPPPPPPPPPQKKREAGRGVEAAAGRATPAPSAAAEASRGAGARASATEASGNPGSAPAPGSLVSHKGRRDKPAEAGKGGGPQAAGGKSGGAELSWKPGQCAEWCRAEAAADECALGGCVACTHCQSAARLAKTAETKPAKPAGPSAHDKLLTHPLLLPFPLPKHQPSSALGALIATVVGLSFFVLLALVWLRRHARPQYSALLERLPQRWAQRADLVASLGRSLGGVGYRAAYKGEGTDDAGTDVQPAAWEGGAYPAPPQGGGQRASADEDPFDEHARVAA